MPNIPAFCDNCGAMFSSGIFVDNCLNLTLSNNKSGPCPKCGSIGHIPDGVFNIIGNTIQILSAPDRTIDELRRLAEIFKQARKTNKEPKEVAETIERELPKLTSIMQFMPANRAEWYAFVALVLAAVQIYLAASPPPNQASSPATSVIINQVIEQTIVNERSIRATPHQGRNEQCACGSGKKYKKCCGNIQR